MPDRLLKPLFLNSPQEYLYNGISYIGVRFHFMKLEENVSKTSDNRDIVTLNRLNKLYGFCSTNFKFKVIPNPDIVQLLKMSVKHKI